ncbi:MAG: hypothetical protein ABIY55_34980, partial [Kofleriaceae bacterium]
MAIMPAPQFTLGATQRCACCAIPWVSHDLGLNAFDREPSDTRECIERNPRYAAGSFAVLAV